MRKPFILTTAVLCASSAGAHAVGFKTQLNCASDYYSYCSQYSVGTPEVRKCMRANGPRLSKGCINALIEDGEVSKAEVEREKEKLVAAKSKAAEPKKADVAAKKAEVALKKPEAQPKKADVAALKKPVPEAKKPVTKLAAAVAPAPVLAKPQAAAPVITRAAAAEMPKAPAPEVPRQMVSLDQKTFDALKARGVRFVADDSDDSDEDISPATLPADPIEAKNQPRARTDTRVAAHASPVREPASDSRDDSGVAADPINETGTQDIADAGEPLPRQPRDYPPGRMSLGSGIQKSPSGEQPSSWWDTIVRTFTGE